VKVLCFNYGFVFNCRYLFFVDWEMTGQSHHTVIKRSELDGSNLRVIVNRHHAGLATDLAIDYQGKPWGEGLLVQCV